MSDSSESLRLTIGSDPYYLLRTYAKQAKVSSYAYSLSEQYHMKLYKWFNYPVIILTSISTVIASLNLNTYIIMGVSVAMLILLAFDKLINPIERSHEANLFKVEYNEIASNIKLFIMNNERTLSEVKNYGTQIHELLNKWKSMNPSIPQRFVKQSNIKYASKLRKHASMMIVPNPSPRNSVDSKKRRLSGNIDLLNTIAAS